MKPPEPTNPQPTNPPTQLVMARLHLEGLPQLQLAAGYTLRSFLRGDEPSWNALVSKAFESHCDFNATLRADPLFQPERVLFIEYQKQIVATACAWRYPKWGEQTGSLHMVAASSEHQGHRLGYMVSLAALQQIVREGVHHAILHTDDYRLPAIATYLKLGFSPFLIEPSHAERWHKIYQILRFRF